MSAISEKVRVALYNKLNVASVMTAGATGVYYHTAPEGAVLPYIVFSRVAPGAVKRAAFDTNLVLEDDLWQISVFVDEDVSTTEEPHKVAGDILTAAEAAIGTDLTISGNTVEAMFRASDIPSMSNLSNGRYIYHEGFNWRTQTS
jgi:hypothetical protein